MTDINIEDIEELLLLFSRKGQYDARAGEQGTNINKICEELFERDYVCSVIENDKGCLSSNYPSHIIIPTNEKSPILKDVEVANGSASGSRVFNASKFTEIASISNVARCRTRFPVPVILCRGKFVCRSATLSCGVEMLIRDMSSCIFSNSLEIEEKNFMLSTKNGAIHTELRSQDIKLLKELSVNYICDLMVENKKVKYGLKVSSSEKVDKEKRYWDFNIVQLPYPGCEFFKKFKDSNYVAEGLMFDWEQNYVDVHLTLPSDSIASSLGIFWVNYKKWDLVKLTQSYLRLLITYVTEGTSSILIHCISGWDRTPLFISLLRLTLWADGRIHQSLTPVEMAYLTLAYDWYLFGHDLPSRLKVGEEILFFCFDFLKFITSDEYSSKKRCRKISSNCVDQPLDILFEEEPLKSSACLQKTENGRSSTFYTTLEGSQESNSPAMFYTSLDSGDDSDSVKSVKLNSLTESGLSESGEYPPTLVNSLDGSSNNNVLAPASSPVPVPNVRQRFDSMSSLGSWQYVSGTGSLMGSVTSKCSTSDNNSNSNSSNSSSHLENGNIAGSTNSTVPIVKEREERLIAVRTIIHRAYRKAIESKDNINGERYSYFPWRR